MILLDCYMKSKFPDGKVSNMILAYYVKYLELILNIEPWRELRIFDLFCIFPTLFIQ